LPKQVVDDLRAFAHKTPCYGNVSREITFLPRNHKQAESIFRTPILVGHYLKKLMIVLWFAGFNKTLYWLRLRIYT
jgi:hypothetical protein